MTQKKNQVAVKILDHEFSMSTDLSVEKAREIAEAVNEEIESVLLKNRGISAYKAVVLAALILGEKYVMQKDELQNFKSDTKLRAEKILNQLES